MRRRWYYWKRMFRTWCPFLILAAVCAGILAAAVNHRDTWQGWGKRWYESYGVRVIEGILDGWSPAGGRDSAPAGGISIKTELLRYLEELETVEYSSEDPAYERMLAREWERDLRRENELAMAESSEDESDFETAGDRDSVHGNDADVGATEGSDSALAGEVIAMKPAGTVVIREKLADYDYVMKQFYSVHPTTTAGRDLIRAERFLSMDFRVETNGNDPEKPQILIYHTHSQEEYADYPENPDATIVGVGERLAELLEGQGYSVLHDTSVYDVQDGELDRSRAYTYALDGISGILQKYPSIEVVLDLHRDGVAEETRLVTEIDGTKTARVMFFNGTSQTPDGLIEYLPNPNREANMAFSFQMQLKAAEQYPGWTRKIYLKGLRYNQHVRARTALVEVGAQTNTYAEALHAMEPLADIIGQVLGSSEPESQS